MSLNKNPPPLPWDHGFGQLQATGRGGESDPIKKTSIFRKSWKCVGKMAEYILRPQMWLKRSNRPRHVPNLAIFAAQFSKVPKRFLPKIHVIRTPPPFLAKMGFVRDQNRPKMVRWHPKPIQGPIRRGFWDFWDFWHFWCFVTPERPLPNHWLFSIFPLRNCNCSIGTTVYKWSEAESGKA